MEYNRKNCGVEGTKGQSNELKEACKDLVDKVKETVIAGGKVVKVVLKKI